jgi:penicillin-binding protein 1C
VIAQTMREPLLAPLFAERLRRLRPGRWQAIESTLDAGMQQSGRIPACIPAGRCCRRACRWQRWWSTTARWKCAPTPARPISADDARFAHVDMVQAARSPGSTLKPFLYGLALDEGLIHSESLLADVPQSFSGYQPGNFQANFSGPVSVSEALQKSLNVPAVEVLERLGAQRFVSLLRRGGLKLALPRGAAANLSVILGGTAVTLEGLVGAYTALARGGVSGQPRYFADAPLEEARMMSEGAAFIIRDILEAGGPVARQVNEGVGARRGIAWKTGTSFGFRDAWAVGVSDRFTVGVWIGRPDGTPNPGFFGANIAAPLLVDVFAVVDDSPPGPRTPPPNVAADPHLLATRHAQRPHAARALPSGTNGLDSQRHRAADLRRPIARRQRALYRLPRRRQRPTRPRGLCRRRDDGRRHGALASRPRTLARCGDASPRTAP